MNALPDLNKPTLIAEPKLDGARFLLYIGADPYDHRQGTTILSRQRSKVDGKYVNRSDQVRHITKEYPGLEGTILDGELLCKDLPTTTGILLSNPNLAIQKQKAEGWLTFHAFDIPFYRGTDLRCRTLAERRKVLDYVVKKIDNSWIVIVPQYSGNLDLYFHKVVASGGEGIVVKSLNAPYGVGWTKLKKVYDFSCIITGFKPGSGTFSDLVGAIALSVYQNGKLVEIGFTSGFDMELRNDMTNRPDEYLGTVVDVFAQEISKPTTDAPLGRLRHPTFHRFRPDIAADTCTIEKLRTDIAAQKTVFN